MLIVKINTICFCISGYEVKLSMCVSVAAPDIQSSDDKRD